MKRFLLIIFFALLLQLKANAQFPFYGFELSNYEVGDTLEYYYYLSSGLGYFQSYQLYQVLHKDIFANDSIKYSFDFISGYPPYFFRDTVSKTVNNDTIFKNNNNLFGVALWDTTGYFSSGSLVYDTVAGLKRIKLKIDQVFYQKNYEVIENAGIINWGGVVA